ncbi:Acyl-coenzyme A synthetase acsm3 [Porites harrisoni]
MDCGVVGVPESGNEIVKAFVILSKDFRRKNQDELKKELQDHVRCNTGAWMCPKEVEFIEDLPRTMSAKTNRRELRNGESMKRQGHGK